MLAGRSIWGSWKGHYGEGTTVDQISLQMCAERNTSERDEAFKGESKSPPIKLSRSHCHAFCDRCRSLPEQRLATAPLRHFSSLHPIRNRPPPRKSA